MTCIVGMVDDDGRVWMGGDRAGVDQSHYLIHCASPKVFRRGGMLFGYTSSFRMGQLLQYRLLVPERPAEQPLEEYMATAFIDAVRQCLKDGGYTKIVDSRETIGLFLVGVSGTIFTVDDDYNVLATICGFAAVGSGLSVALGSLHTSDGLGLSPERRLNVALGAASQFVTGVRPPFDILSEPPLQSTTSERAR